MVKGSRGEVPDLKFNPSLLVLLASIHWEVCYFCLRTESQAVASVSFPREPSRGETAPDRRKSRRCADLHGRRQPIYRNRCCSARVSHVHDYLCIFGCVRACSCVAGRERAWAIDAIPKLPTSMCRASFGSSSLVESDRRAPALSREMMRWTTAITSNVWSEECAERLFFVRSKEQPSSRPSCDFTIRSISPTLLSGLSPVAD